MVSNILLDVNIIVDILAKRIPFKVTSILAYNAAVLNNIRIWVYVGSVQTLHYILAKELIRNSSLSFKSALIEAKELLETFTADVQWLPALSEDSDVWNAVDPEDEQLKKLLIDLVVTLFLLREIKKS